MLWDQQSQVKLNGGCGALIAEYQITNVYWLYDWEVTGSLLGTVGLLPSAGREMSLHNVGYEMKVWSGWLWRWYVYTLHR